MACASFLDTSSMADFSAWPPALPSEARTIREPDGSAGLRSLTLLALALDLLVPPLAALLLAVLVLALAAAALAAFGGSALPLAITLLALALIALAVGVAWARFGRGLVSFAELALAPLWALAKLPLYLGFLVKRQTQWVRTSRDEPRR